MNIWTCSSNTGSYAANLKITRCVFLDNFLTYFLINICPKVYLHTLNATW